MTESFRILDVGEFPTLGIFTTCVFDAIELDKTSNDISEAVLHKLLTMRCVYLKDNTELLPSLLEKDKRSKEVFALYLVGVCEWRSHPIFSPLQ